MLTACLISMLTWVLRRRVLRKQKLPYLFPGMHKVSRCAVGESPIHLLGDSVFYHSV